MAGLRLTYLLVAALVVAVSAAPAQSVATLRGTVVSADSTPVEGAEIFVPGVPGPARSDASGRFRIAVAPGALRVTIRKIGFAAKTVQLTVTANDSTPRRFNLGAPQSLDSITVSSGRSGITEFEERRKRHVGHFITRDELERSTSRRMGDQLRGLQGLRIMENPNNRSEAWAVLARGRGTLMSSNSACFMQVYMDDNPVYTGPPEMPFNLNTLTTHDVEAVEYYSGGSSIPAKYNRTGSSCGVIVIWTRR